MLETAYVSAEASHRGGGREFLNKFARLLAANHTDAIRYEPSLADVFPETSGTPVKEAIEPWTFAVPTPEQLKAPLPPEAKQLERYPNGLNRLGDSRIG